MEKNNTTLPAAVRDAVLVKSVPHDALGPEIRGYDFNKGLNLSALLDSYLYTGFQATNFGLACEEINKMLEWRLSQEPLAEDEDDEYKSAEKRASVKCKIYLAYTSNMVSSGLREVVRYLVQHKLVDVVVTTAGGIEEDFIKCMASTHLGDFGLSGPILRSKGLNRIGNLLVPNENYCKFEDWIMPIFDKMLVEQKAAGTVWTPSSVIARLGKEINHEDSIYYWAQKNDIPVFCPALTDGSLGDMLYFHSYSNPGLVIDLVQDIRAINSSAVFARKTGVVILGGGVVKHHVCNANLMRNGADYAVYVNTGQEFDGSDAGASPEEAKSWGKIKAQARPVKIYGDATLVFPLLVAQTFAKYQATRK